MEQKLLSTGTYSRVYDLGNNVALKYYNNNDETKEEEDFNRIHVLNAIGEIIIYKICKSDNIVNFYNYNVIDGNFELYIEMCKYDLFDYILDTKNISHDESREIIHSICKGIKGLHKNNFVHNDLTCRNVLLSENGVWKVCDFSCSMFCKDKMKIPTIYQCSSYITPEMNEDLIICKSSDIWMIGMICASIKLYAPDYHLLSKLNEIDIDYFYSCDYDDIVDHAFEVYINLSKMLYLREIIHKELKGTLNINKNTRPSISQLLNRYEKNIIECDEDKNIIEPIITQIPLVDQECVDVLVNFLTKQLLPDIETFIIFESKIDENFVDALVKTFIKKFFN